jgi:benzylsuccinate CoA-transferase BbsE subunit
MKWMVEEGATDPAVLDIDWKTLPARIVAGDFTDADMQPIRADVAAFLAGKTKDEVLRAAMERKLLCVPIYDTADVAHSAQLEARDFFVELGEGDRKRRLPGAYAKVNADAFAITRPAPLLGEHTTEVLMEATAS